MIMDIAAVYTAAKYWIPLSTLFVMVFKAYTSGKRSIGAWAEKLLSNHLTHIQAATESTVLETKKTNVLLETAAVKQDATSKEVTESKNLLKDNAEKQLQVWQGVVKTLAVLEDRTRRSSPRTPRKRS